MVEIGAKELERVLDYPSLISAVKQMFLSDAENPERHHHTIPVPGKLNATLLLMPSWKPGQYVGLKTATIFPSNTEEDKPSVMATYLLLDGCTGQPLAAIDGKALTGLRTAATSALVADLLANPNASTMTMIGAGALARPLVRAHSSIRNLKQINLWNRSPERLKQLYSDLKAESYPVEIVQDLESAVRSSDIVSTATLSRSALVRGHWVGPGTHLDLVGAYTGHMQEVDTDSVRKSRVFVDSVSGGKEEAGDLILAAESGDWDYDRIAGDIVSLLKGATIGRTSPDEITLFKSVGSALEDLAAAILAYERMQEQSI